MAQSEATPDDDTDIVDHLSEATGFFHDDDAARLRDIADASGQKPVGVVKAAVEKEIERREWRCVYFDPDEDREYISSNAYEYYRIHRSFQLEYEAALEALPTEENAHLREVPIHEHAAETLEDKAREHRAKAEQAEQWLKEHGHELPEVEVE
jgi:hypothetical protein